LSPTENKLAAPLTALKGVGPALARTLERLGACRVEDLLFLLPLRYEDRTRLVNLGEVRPGDRCLVSGEVQHRETVYRGRRSLLVHIADDTGEITLRFFYFTRQQQAQFQEGVRVSCYGDVRPGSRGLEIIHPEYRILKADQSPVISDALTPVYSITEGIQQGRLRNLVGQALKIMRAGKPEELLPDEVLASLRTSPGGRSAQYRAGQTPMPVTPFL